MQVGTRSVLFGVHQFLIHPLFVALAWWKLYGFPWDPRLWVAFFVHDLGYVGKPNLDGPEGERHVELGARIMHWLFDRRQVPGCWETHIDDNGKIIQVRWSIPDGQGHYFVADEYWCTRLGRTGASLQAARLNAMIPPVLPQSSDSSAPAFRRSTRWHDFCLYHSRYAAKRDRQPFSRLCVADKLAIGLMPAWLYLPLAKLSGELPEYMEGKNARTPAGDRSPSEWYRDVQRYCTAWAFEHRDGRNDTWTGTKRDLAREEFSLS
jgi:hypothetical protein